MRLVMLPAAVVGFLLTFASVPASFSDVPSLLQLTRPKPLLTPSAIQTEEVEQECFKAPPCDATAKYRTCDGSCNNLQFPVWGMVNTSFVRLLPARYADGLAEPRKSVNGGNLRDARELRDILFPNKDIPDKVNTLVTMQWGQLVAHDTMLSTSQQPGSCCAGKEYSTKEAEKPGCIPIRIPENDSFYRQYGNRCMDMARTVNTGNLSCKFLPAQQISQVTAFLDASPTYGSNKQTEKDLRQMKGGQLKVQIHEGSPYLPQADNPSQTCFQSDVCYKAGDIRVNQNPGIAVLQTSLMRQHNTWARKLAALNPQWSDEQLYQEARRINIAVLQHITYAEWLPVILGGKAQASYGNVYDPLLHPGSLNMFTAGCFRYFHTIIAGIMKSVKPDYTTALQVNLSDVLNCPHAIQQDNNYDGFLRGISSQPMDVADIHNTAEITDKLFKNGKPFGLDLSSIDIQRGRDHGLPTYNDARKYCGLPAADSFLGFTDAMTEEHANKLSQGYASPDDVDLLVGATMETHEGDAMVGPTCNCIIKEQFKRWKLGDRFFYDLVSFPGSFSKEQLQEIQKETLASVFCRNGNNITEIQPQLFYKISSSNSVASCSSIPSLSLEPWKCTSL